MGIKDLESSKKDLEKFIGENLVEKIGVLVLFVAAVIAYRLGISNGVIPVWLRIAVGVGIGGGILALSHFILSKRNRITTVLVSLSALIFYYVTYLLVDDYQLIGAGLGILLITTITGGCFALSSLYHRKELLTIGACGGYISPLMLSAGGGLPVVFYLYLAAQYYHHGYCL